jgi:copper chaperone NosL
MSPRRIMLLVLACAALSACSPGSPRPAQIDTRNDQCANCRMTISNARFAAQIVAQGEEPRLFDDIGCLREFLGRQALEPDAVAYVADHHTRAWVVAARAIYVRNEQVHTPMGSHLIAFADLSSFDADPDARDPKLSGTDVFGPGGPPAGGEGSR